MQSLYSYSCSQLSQIAAIFILPFFNNTKSMNESIPENRLLFMSNKYKCIESYV